MFSFSKKSECEHMQELISEHLDQRLSSEESVRVENHLNTCKSCHDDYESLRDAVSLLSHSPVATVRRSFTIAEAQPASYPSFFGTLRTATMVLAAMLVMLFAGDMTHIIPGALPEPIQPTVSETSTSSPLEDDVIIRVSNEGVPTPEGSLSGGIVIPPPKAGEEGPAPQGVQIEEKQPGPSETILEPPSPISETPIEGLWWLHPLEISLLAIIAVMSGITIYIRRKHKALYVRQIDIK